MTKVKCSVKSCEFWGDGELCKADSIWVKNSMANDIDDDLYSTEFSDEFEDSDIDNAYTSQQTCCETMRPRRT